MRCVWSSHVRPVGFSLCQRKPTREKGKTIFSIYFLVRWFFGSQNCHWFFIGLVIVANFYSSFDCLVNPQSLSKSGFFWMGISIIFQSNLCDSYVYIYFLSIFNILYDIHKLIGRRQTKKKTHLDFIFYWIVIFGRKWLKSGWNWFHLYLPCSISIKSSETYIRIRIHYNHFKTTDRMPFN